MRNGDISVKQLLEFCCDYDVIACYGAKRYGKFVKRFLEIHDIYVKFFIVTSKEDEYFDGIPVYEISELNGCAENLGIVLTLSEKYQNEVTQLVRDLLGEKQGIFSCNVHLLQCVHDILCIQSRQRKLLSCADFSENEDYEKKILAYKQKYSKISVYNMDCRYLGIIGAEWPYLCCEHMDEKNFYLYYPVTLDGELIGPNEEILYRLSGKGIGIIHRKNIEFWRYFIGKHKDYFIFYDNKPSVGYYRMQERLHDLIKSGHRWLVLNHDDEQSGKILKAQMNIIDDYVCISSRDNDYSVDHNDYSVTKEMIGKLRNSCIETYSMAVDYLGKEKLQAVRMGAMVKGPYRHSNVVDYAFIGYSSFMDVYLAYNCKFFVANLSGITTLPVLCGKPVVLVNVALFTVRYDAMPFTTEDTTIMVCKKMYDTKRDRFLTLREMIEYEVASSTLDMNMAEGTSLLYERNGIIAVDNSPAEILAAVKEMNDRINNDIVYTPEEEKLHRRVKDILASVECENNILLEFRFCSEFLVNNTWLLE